MSFSWRNHPELMTRLQAAQNHPAHEHRDVMTIVGFFSSVDELARHVVSIEEQAAQWQPPARRRRQAA